MSLKTTAFGQEILQGLIKTGFLYIVSRKSDLIKSGAHRIGPKEIEEVILEHHAVHEVAVFGVDDKILGEAIHACIVLKEENSATQERYS